ncbi:MAG: FAD-binding oxidoreductase [Marmoricola sp.]|jgi:glycolate oxidase FAD binding subunit|nr:FAD-binding oxidoreductase [Marmoricola sp.]
MHTDLIVAAEAGARLSDVQAIVGQDDQRLSHGTARDLLIGVTVVRRLLGPETTSSPHPPGGSATHPWDPAATGDDRATALKLGLPLSGLRQILATADHHGVALRGCAGTGAVYAAIAPGTPLVRVQEAVDGLRAACTHVGGAAVVLDAA